MNEDTNNLFEQATRAKLRFNTSKGLLSIEDLWDLTLTTLNSIAKGLNMQLRASEEEDFLKENSRADKILAGRFTIVLHILETKKQEKKDRLDATVKSGQKAKLLNALARKKDEALDDMSEEEIQKAIENL